MREKKIKKRRRKEGKENVRRKMERMEEKGD